MLATGWRALADTVLLLHVGVVSFIVAGLLLVLIGGRAGWSWVRRWDFRIAHLAAIVYVAAQSWLGIACPLTVLESWLRRQAGQRGYERSFIEDWMQQLLYHDLPAWIFVAAYTAFALVVALAWWRVPPGRRSADQPLA